MLNQKSFDYLARLVDARGLTAVGRVISVQPASLANALIGRGRPSTVGFIEAQVVAHRAELDALLADAEGSRAATMRDDVRTPLRA